MSKNKTRVSFSIEAELAKQMRVAANEEGIKLARFTRRLLEWAC